MQIVFEATPQLYFASTLSPLQLMSILQHAVGHLVMLPSPSEIFVQLLLLNFTLLLLTQGTVAILTSIDLLLHLIVYLLSVLFLILDPFVSCLDLQIGLNRQGIRCEPFQRRKTGRIAIELLLQHGVG